MPTYDFSVRFRRDLKALDRTKYEAFRKAVAALIADLREGRDPRPGLRIKGVQSHRGVFEMTYAPDGRATFAYGQGQQPGETHIVWRRVGAHDVLRNP